MILRMGVFRFQAIADWLSNQAKRLEASGLIVEWQTIDLPVRSVRLRVESSTHIGEIVVWAERGMVSISVAEFNGAFVLDQNFEMTASDYSRFDDVLKYFQV